MWFYTFVLLSRSLSVVIYMVRGFSLIISYQPNTLENCLTKYLYQESLSQLSPKDEEDEDDLDEELGDEGLICLLSISEKLSTFNSLVKSLPSFIENSNSSVEHDRYDEVNCVNVYIKKLLIIFVPIGLSGESRR